jgi:uncharacterized Zn-binding protein involved in type VI secretion
MGLGVAIITAKTIGTCSDGDHNGPIGGTVISGSANVFTNGLGTSFLTATVQADCGDTGIIVSGAAAVFVNGLAAGVIGSKVVPGSGGKYTGTVISGSANVFAG